MAECTRRQHQTYVEREPSDVFDYLRDTRNWSRITPEPDPDQLIAGGGGVLSRGDVVTLRTARGGRFETMTVVMEECDDAGLAVERQLSGPFAQWVLHRRVKAFENGALVTEMVEYCPGGALGLLPARLRPGGPVDDWMTYRLAAVKRILEQRMRVKGVPLVR